MVHDRRGDAVASELGADGLELAVPMADREAPDSQAPLPDGGGSVTAPQQLSLEASLGKLCLAY